MKLRHLLWGTMFIKKDRRQLLVNIWMHLWRQTTQWINTLQKVKKQVIRHLPHGKFSKIAKAIFFFRKANKNNKCQLEIVIKIVNQKDGLGMKVTSSCIFTAEEKYLKILKKKVPQLL